jgi:rare lipoprotein A
MSPRFDTWGVGVKYLSLALFLLVASCSNQPAFAESMVASYYGSESGSRTANGERFNPNGLTAAHRTLPFGTRLRVCRAGCVVVRISDRGPFIRGRQLDLSKGAAAAIGLTRVGVGKIEVSRIP